MTEKELLAIVYAVDKFKHYITGYSNFVHTDDSTIKYLMNTPITNARVIRWLLILQHFHISIVDRPAEENVVAEFISQLTHNDDNLLVEESFLDKHLFIVSGYSPWYTNITNYLDVGKILAHLSKRERRRIIQKSARYHWI